MNRKIQERLQWWVKMYEVCSDAALLQYQRCGISRLTLSKWPNRQKQDGIVGLEIQSKPPHFSPATKINDKVSVLIPKK